MFDYPAKWMLDIQPQGKEWNYEKLCFEFYTTLRRLGLSIDIISPDHDISKYKLVVAPSLPVIPKNLLQSAKISKTKLLFGPRSGSKTSEYQIPPKYPFNRDFKFIKSESLRDGASLKINMNDKIYYSKNWRDIIECKGINKIEFSDGHPAYIHNNDYGYIATWPTYELLKDLLINLTEKIGIKTTCLDENIRMRHTKDLTFAFNYGDEILDISKMAPESKFIYGGSKIDPYGVSIWKTQKNK
jgi:beta-galactosidase